MSIQFDKVQIGDLVRVHRKKMYHQVITLFPETKEVEVVVKNHSCRFSIDDIAEIRR